MDNVVILSTKINLDIPVERVLDNFPRDARSCIVIGETESGELYFASSLGKFSATLWLIELAKKMLLEAED